MTDMESSYKKLNESVHPSSELIESTLEMMGREKRGRTVTLSELEKRKTIGTYISRYAPIGAAAAALIVAMIVLPKTLNFGAKSAAPDDAPMMMYDGGSAEAAEDSLPADATTNEKTDAAPDADSEIAYQESAESDSAESGDVTIYIASQGEASTKTVYIEKTLDNVLAEWCGANGSPDIALLSCGSVLDNASLTVNVDLTGGGTELLKSDGDLLASLVRTLMEYLGSDGVVITVDGEAM